MKISLASRCCHTHPFVLAFHQASPFARALQRPSLFSPSLLFLSEDHSLSLSQRLARTRPTHPSRALEQSPARASPLKEQEIRLFFFLLRPSSRSTPTRRRSFHFRGPQFAQVRPKFAPSSPKTAPSVLYRSAGRGARPASGGRPSVSRKGERSDYVVGE